MAILVDEVVDEARDFHPAFSPQIHPDQVLIRALHRAEMEFYDRASQIAPDALAVDLVYDAAAIAAGILGGALTIPAYRAILPTAVMVNDNGMFSATVGEEELSSGVNPLQIRILGRSLYIAQPTAFQAEMPSEIVTELQDESYWKDASSLRVSYIPHPVVLAAGGTMIAPDDARRFMQGALVNFMCTRDPTIGQEKPQIREDAAYLQASVLQLYESRAAAEARWYVARHG